MFAYDVKEGKLILSHFKPTMEQPQLAADYIRTNLEALAKDIHPLDQVELHKQTDEMLYSTLADKVILAQQLQNSLNNTSAQLELERVSSLAKDNRIKSLEEIIIELGHNPKDPKTTKVLIKKKEDDIVALKKQLKLPTTMHPQATKFVKEKEEEDMMELLIKVNQRLSETEQALEKAMQEKYGELAPQTAQTTPIATTAPPTAKTSAPPTTPASTTGTSATDTSTVATTPVPDTSMSMERTMRK